MLNLRFRKNFGPAFTLVVVLFPLLTFPSLTWGDRFELTDGRRFEGSIVRELGDLVSIRTSDGKVVTIERSLIKYHKKSAGVLDEFESRRKALDPTDAEGHFKLAKWCETKSLRGQAVQMYRTVVKIAPNHAGARAALDHEFIGGAWYKRGSPEAAARKRELEEALKKLKPPKEKPDDGATGNGGTARRPKDRPRPATPGAPIDRARVADAPTVELRLDELLDTKAPEYSMFANRIEYHLALLEKPLRVVTPKKPAPEGEAKTTADYTLEVNVRVYFVKTHKFYKRMALFNVYQGDVTMVMKNAKTGQTVLKITKLEVPVTVNLEKPREAALQQVYGEVVGEAMHYLSKKPFLTQRGGKVIPLAE